ncbi:hypothetical protein [Streptomyces sp. x-80]|uniref:hypothetical protein n=1 Tax=Streptomyces sp. x-80 TaxID=2789282 RepID=UPI003980F3D9
MSTPTSAPAPADTPAPAEPTEAAAPEPAPAPAEPAPEADDDWSDPERGREAKRKANQEARKLRAEVDALKKQLELRVDPEESKAAIALVEAESARQVARIRYGHQYGLPEEFIDRLRGDTTEDIEADAKALSVHFAPSAGLGRGGLDPTDTPAETDPRKLAAGIPRFH